MRSFAAFAALSSAAACATPGIDYVADMAPGNPSAGSYRVVAVENFDGPYSAWYEERFEDMLAAALFQDAPWFRVALFPAQSNVDGVYGGAIEVYPVETYTSFYTTSHCVKEDEETEDCLTRKEVEHFCTDFHVEVAVNPQLFDPKARALVHDAVYTARESDKVCAETGFVEFFSKVEKTGDTAGDQKRRAGGKGRRARHSVEHRAGAKYPFRYAGFEHPGYIPDPDYVVDGLFRDALFDTIWQARRDIAPYNQILRAEFVTEPRDAVLMADARFPQAIDAAKSGDIHTSCALWAELEAENPTAGEAKHNLAACAEAIGDYARAQTLYAEAAQMLAPYGADAGKRTRRALARISERRQDRDVLDRLLDADPSPDV